MNQSITESRRTNDVNETEYQSITESRRSNNVNESDYHSVTEIENQSVEYQSDNQRINRSTTRFKGSESHRINQLASSEHHRTRVLDCQNQTISITASQYHSITVSDQRVIPPPRNKHSRKETGYKETKKQHTCRTTIDQSPTSS